MSKISIYTSFVTVISLKDDRLYVRLSELLVRWQSFIIVNVTYNCWVNPVKNPAIIQVHTVYYKVFASLRYAVGYLFQ